MSYFHTGIRTIIGAEAFHCPVRDGKEWDHLAMVIRLNRSPPCIRQGSQFAESTRVSTSGNQILIAHRLHVEERYNTHLPNLDCEVKVIGSSLTSN